MDQRLPEAAGAAPPDWRGLCEELVSELHGYASANPHHDSDALVARARAALASTPTDESGRDPLQDALERMLAVVREANTAFKPLAELLDSLAARTAVGAAADGEGVKPTRDDLWELWLRLNNELPDRPAAVAEFWEHAQIDARARWGRPVPAPAEGEVAELVAWLRANALTVQKASGNPANGAKQRMNRAADLLERHPAPVPAGMIPVEYWDIDSGARIVTEPSEEGPGGCWVVLNSRHVNPFTEFPTAKAAWDALQQAHALPLPQGEV